MVSSASQGQKKTLQRNSLRHALTSEIGFVPQDDVVFERLTVYQNLYFSAMLRLPSNMSHSQKIGIIEDVLAILDLNGVRNSFVGNASGVGIGVGGSGNSVGGSHSGQGCGSRISGGQRKRVNIGLELVAYPRILFLDEPTSGLDAAAAYSVVQCLSRLKDLGITVVAVIHQPSFAVFSSFTDLVLLAPRGKLAYIGPPNGVLDYFLKLGFDMLRLRDNVADWMMNVITGGVSRRNQKRVFMNEFRTPDDFKREWEEEMQ